MSDTVTSYIVHGRQYSGLLRLLLSKERERAPGRRMVVVVNLFKYLSHTLSFTEVSTQLVYVT